MAARSVVRDVSVETDYPAWQSLAAGFRVGCCRVKGKIGAGLLQMFS
jgi:hypothetical protein